MAEKGNSRHSTPEAGPIDNPATTGARKRRSARRSRHKVLPRGGAARIIAAPSSTIMIVGALALVELAAGMIEASMTRSASSP